MHRFSISVLSGHCTYSAFVTLSRLEREGPILMTSKSIMAIEPGSRNHITSSKMHASATASFAGKST